MWASICSGTACLLCLLTLGRLQELQATPQQNYLHKLIASNPLHQNSVCKQPRLRCLQELGTAGLTKRPTSCMLVLPKLLKGGEPDEDYDTTYEAVFEKVKSVQPAF